MQPAIVIVAILFVFLHLCRLARDFPLRDRTRMRNTAFHMDMHVNPSTCIRRYQKWCPATGQIQSLLRFPVSFLLLLRLQ